MTISENEKKVLKRAARIMEREMRYGDTLSSPAKVREFLNYRFALLEHEVFAMIALDNRHRVIEYVELFRGTVDGAAVYPREVIQEVPDALALIDVRVLDHLVIGHNASTSLAERGLL